MSDRQTDRQGAIVFHIYIHPFNGPLSGTTQVSWYQKGKTNLDFTEARDSEWQWNPLGHMQVCTSLQADNHTSTPLLSFFTGRMPFLPPNQQCQSTEGNSVFHIYRAAKKYTTQPSTNSCCPIPNWGTIQVAVVIVIVTRETRNRISPDNKVGANDVVDVVRRAESSDSRQLTSKKLLHHTK